MPESILKKALEFLGEPPVESAPEVESGAPKKLEYRGTNKYELITPGDTLFEANRNLKSTFPNLIFEDPEVDRVISWVRIQEGISLDIET